MNEEFYLYILKCSDGSYYTGHTDNIEKRISEHHLGVFARCYTKSRRPLTVVFLEMFGSRYEALSAERQIKKWSRKKKEAFISDNWSLVTELAKKKF